MLIATDSEAIRGLLRGLRVCDHPTCSIKAQQQEQMNTSSKYVTANEFVQKYESGLAGRAISSSKVKVRLGRRSIRKAG